MNDPPIHSQSNSPIVCFRIFKFPRKLETKKTGTVNYTVGNTRLLLIWKKTAVNF